MIKPIEPICFVKRCIVCEEDKPEFDIKMIEEDSINNNEGKYICNTCLAYSEAYRQCDKCGIVYNSKGNQENGYNNVCSDCNSGSEEVELLEEENEDLIDLTEFYND